MVDVALRPIDDSDLDALFEQMRDPESVWMGAFTTKDPNDRAAFDIHMAKVLATPENTTLAVTADGRFAGTIASFVLDGDTELTYWIDRSLWGHGIASRAWTAQRPGKHSALSPFVEVGDRHSGTLGPPAGGRG